MYSHAEAYTGSTATANGYSSAYAYGGSTKVNGNCQVAVNGNDKHDSC